MSEKLSLSLVVLRKMLIPALTALGGFVAGLYPGHFTAFCGSVL